MKFDAIYYGLVPVFFRALVSSQVEIISMLVSFRTVATLWKGVSLQFCISEHEMVVELMIEEFYY